VPSWRDGPDLRNLPGDMPLEHPRSAQRAPPYLSLKACLVLAVAGAAAGAGLRLVRPVDRPDAALLERLERWKALAPEIERSHRLRGPARAG
jgi:hypothetical protein